VVIKAGRSRFSLSTLPATEFPVIDDINSQQTVQVPRKELLDRRTRVSALAPSPGIRSHRGVESGASHVAGRLLAFVERESSRGGGFLRDNSSRGLARPGGEAFIKVHHDKARPFTVRAGAMSVTAVGTAFDVRREADRVTVTVEEGTIVASAIGPNGVNEWRAGAGYQVEYSEDLRTAVVSRVDTDQASTAA
jgi:hypothetical protein